MNKKQMIIVGALILVLVVLVVCSVISKDKSITNEPEYSGGEEADDVTASRVVTRAEAYRIYNIIAGCGIPKNNEGNLSCREFAILFFEAVQALGYDYREKIEYLPEKLLNAKADDEVDEESFKIMTEKLKGELIKEKTINVIYEDAGKLYDEKGDMYLFGSGFDHGEETYLLCRVTAVCCGEHILYVKRSVKSEFNIPNVWVTDASDTDIGLFINGVNCTYQASLAKGTDISGCIADVSVREGKLSGLSVKKSIITGKVLVSDDEGVELENVGRINFAPDVRMYKVYDAPEMESSKGILVGYSLADFVISEGKIAAVLLRERLSASNIRVAINTTGYKGLLHEYVELTSDTNFIVKNSEGETSYEPGTIVRITSGELSGEAGRIHVYPENEDGKLQLLSVERACGAPRYRGQLEVSLHQGGIVVVNELSLEEYLYAVLPGEMPSSYGQEALKVQAVCARSYAYRQMLSNRYSDYGAHVDDSVDCQVYNNLEETEASIQAVRESHGRIITDGEEVISAFYYSTSCGISASVADVWKGSAKQDYLRDRLQGAEGTAVSFDLSSESAFRRFIDENKVTDFSENGYGEITFECFEKDFIWFRWSMEISSERLSELVRKRTGKAVGTIEGIKVTRRGTGGIALEVLIEGSRQDITLCYQTEIRKAFAPSGCTLTRNDGSTVSEMSLLPSAFFYIDRLESGGETIFRFKGGGYGHGTGMSQNGTKAMADLGYNYEEIISFYYEGTKLDVLYRQ